MELPPFFLYLAYQNAHSGNNKFLQVIKREGVAMRVVAMRGTTMMSAMMIVF